jgi:uronate dehydrogenase
MDGHEGEGCQSMKTVALTGGAGMVGQILRRGMADRLASLRTIDVADPGPLLPGEEWVAADITDVDALTEAFTGVDGIVHMAGLNGEREIGDTLRVNVLGTHNVYEAARRAGVKRVVYGSSNHVTGFYPRDMLVTPDMPMRPDSRYGLSKCWGELTAGLFYDKNGIETLSIRIGNSQAQPRDPRGLAIWISPRDLTELVMIGLEHPDIGSTVVFGASRSAAPWWDNSAATALGFVPQDDIADFAHPDAFLPERVEMPEISTFFQGGWFCGNEHDGVLRHRPENGAGSAAGERLAESGDRNARHLDLEG